VVYRPIRLRRQGARRVRSDSRGGFDAVWVSDWGTNAILRFDPKTEKFEPFPLDDRYAGVRQLAGRKGKVWGAESGADKLFVLKAE
jgi:streptogramin lyase